MILHSNWQYVERALGCSLPDRFLMALRAFDNTKAVTPFIVESGGQRFGLFLHVEKGNASAAGLPADIEPVFYQPYFNFDPNEQTPHVHATLEHALQAISNGDRKLSVDGALPIGVTRRLARHFDIVSERRPEAPVMVRRIPRQTVLAHHKQDRPSATTIAKRLIARSRHRDAIESFLLPRSDDRFERLDALLAREGADALFVSSIINVQEIAGVPMRGEYRPIAVIYRPGDGILLIDPEMSGNGQPYASLRDALDATAPHGRLAVEEEDVETWVAESSGLDVRDTVAADDFLRRWRDEGTLPDLPFYIITTRASRFAIDAALDFAQARTRAGDSASELDAYAIYLRALQGFFDEHAPAFRMARTLTNFHAGARTIFPSNAADFPLNSEAGTLKIDAGCTILSKDGMMLGCSDIARTFCFDDASQAYFELFKTAVRDVLIPACREGASGRDIHALAVETVAAATHDQMSNPLYFDIKHAPYFYARDVGHLLGRNNLAHLKFTSAETGTLREGMIACCEYQWPVGRHAIAYEDTCLVTKGGGLNLTVD